MMHSQTTAAPHAVRLLQAWRILSSPVLAIGRGIVPPPPRCPVSSPYLQMHPSPKSYGLLFSSASASDRLQDFSLFLFSLLSNLFCLPLPSSPLPARSRLLPTSGSAHYLDRPHTSTPIHTSPCYNHIATAIVTPFSRPLALKTFRPKSKHQTMQLRLQQVMCCYYNNFTVFFFFLCVRKPQNNPKTVSQEKTQEKKKKNQMR